MAFTVRSHILADLLVLPETTNVDKQDTVTTDCLDFQKFFTKISSPNILRENQIAMGWEERL